MDMYSATMLPDIAEHYSPNPLNDAQCGVNTVVCLVAKNYCSLLRGSRYCRATSVYSACWRSEFNVDMHWVPSNSLAHL